MSTDRYVTVVCLEANIDVFLEEGFVVYNNTASPFRLENTETEWSEWPNGIPYVGHVKCQEFGELDVVSDGKTISEIEIGGSGEPVIHCTWGLPKWESLAKIRRHWEIKNRAYKALGMGVAP